MSAFSSIVKPALFAFSQKDPEIAHNLIMSQLATASRIPIALQIIQSLFGYSHPSLTREVFGLRFPNPVGLAGGFDKNGAALPALAAMGFGFIEAGGVTKLPQPGLPRPRIFRLPEDQAIINRMGLPSKGADAVVEHLRSANQRMKIPIGWQLAKNKETPLENAAEDYVYTMRALYPYADYFSINVSSPNTPGLRTLQNKEFLLDLVKTVTQESQKFASNTIAKPVLVKLAPDLTSDELDDALASIADGGAQGIIATNTTISRDGLRTKTSETGGLSGRPLAAKSLDMVRAIALRTEGKLPIIGVGGIFHADDAKRMFDAGASLIQIYTSFIYEGPAAVKNIISVLAKSGF